MRILNVLAVSRNGHFEVEDVFDTFEEAYKTALNLGIPFTIYVKEFDD